MPRGRTKATETKPKNSNGANLGFEAEMFLAANKLRKNLEPSDYKHVALGLIFLKHISNALEAKRATLLAEDPQAAEDPGRVSGRKRVLGAQGSALVAPTGERQAAPTIGMLIDDAMIAIEARNPQLKGVLPKDYNRPGRFTPWMP